MCVVLPPFFSTAVQLDNLHGPTPDARSNGKLTCDHVVAVAQGVEHAFDEPDLGARLQVARRLAQDRREVAPQLRLKRAKELLFEKTGKKSGRTYHCNKCDMQTMFACISLRQLKNCVRKDFAGSTALRCFALNINQSSLSHRDKLILPAPSHPFLLPITSHITQNSSQITVEISTKFEIIHKNEVALDFITDKILST